MQEMTDSDYGLDLARRAGSELMIRAWFKWNASPPVARWQALPVRAHAFGALFGGGITCSALYDGENGLTREQLLGLATRGPDGQLADAWGQPGIRHGSLSSPAYLDYLLRWCREQIDAGTDVLFMDEINAALGPREGYDDFSLADFRRYLLSDCPETKGWTPTDPRWATTFHADPADRTLCPDGTMASFDYRAWLRARGLAERPDSPDNPFQTPWRRFRAWRDDRAWKSLTDRIRAHARERGRRVWLDANGLAKYVDLQVLGIWGNWTTEGGHIALRDNRLETWRAQVLRGRQLAGRRVPVVFFHDWGFGNPPFPFLAVPPAERALWMRTRGAEIYAAGALFAFPVLGPFGCDANKDGTLGVIAQQSAFHRAHRELYLDADFLGGRALQSPTPNLTLAAWARREPNAIVVHAVNRNLRAGVLQPQSNVVVRLPLDRLPADARVISPDFPGERAAACRRDGSGTEVALGTLDAYSVAILRYEGEVNLRPLRDPARTALGWHWARPGRSEFRVDADGLVEEPDELSGMLQGRLHAELRGPPMFLVHATEPGGLTLFVRAVATLGARLEYRVDGGAPQIVELPDRDGKNESDAPEYDRAVRFPIPAGRHRLSLDNTGGDWASLRWIEFDGAFAPWGVDRRP